MSISKKELEKEIHAILKNADLTEMSAKKVRLQLEENLDCDLTSRKKEIDDMVMDFVNQNEDEEESEAEGNAKDDDGSWNEDSDDGAKKAKNKRQSSSAKKPAKKRKYDSDESSGGDSESGSDYKPNKKTSSAKKGPGRKKKKGSEDDDSDEDYKVPKKAKSKKSGGGGGGGKSTGYTRVYKLSPELSELMGAESLPRHEVVKKMWAIVKERNLYDPKNKQFAICDDALLKVMGVKRFRTFGMMKFLKTHFID